MSKKYFVESRIKEQYFKQATENQHLVESLFSEANILKKHYDIFLSHSSKDEDLIDAIFMKLCNEGFSVFLDKRDANNTAIDEMAKKKKNAMNKSTYLLYLHTHNSKQSKWTPWELGYFDCKKNSKNILVLPTLNDSKEFAPYVGQEYLEQYTKICLEDLYSLPKREHLRDNSYFNY